MQTGMRIKTKLDTRWICSLLAAGSFLLVLAWFSCACAGDDGSTWFVNMSQYAGAAHGMLKCEECHGPMTGELINKSKSHPDPGAVEFLKNPTKRIFDYQTCQKCHKIAHGRFLQGEHAKAAIDEKKTGKISASGHAPNCGDCHSAHYAKPHLSRTLIGKKMTQTCGSCHPDQKASYLASYHGKAAVNLEYDKSALCTDCHGAHITRSLKENKVALAACRRCHLDATAEFANIIIHDSVKNLNLKNETKKAGLKWVHLLGTLSVLFVVAVLLFFYLHTGLLMLRKLQEKLRRHK